jgi:hypothetical protein
VVCVGTTDDLFGISRDDTTKSLDSPKVVKAVGAGHQQASKVTKGFDRTGTY